MSNLIDKNLRNKPSYEIIREMSVRTSKRNKEAIEYGRKILSEFKERRKNDF